MNFMGLIKRSDKVDKAFEELQADMAEALDEGLFDLDDQPPLKSDSVEEVRSGRIAAGGRNPG